jgi:hypothetical protein
MTTQIRLLRYKAVLTGKYLQMFSLIVALHLQDQIVLTLVKYFLLANRLRVRFCAGYISILCILAYFFAYNRYSRLRLKRDGTRAETRFRVSAKRTSPFKSAGVSVQSTTGSRGVRISGSNVGYTMFRGSVKGTGYPLHSPVSPLLPLPCVTVCHHISTGLYLWLVLQNTAMKLRVPQKAANSLMNDRQPLKRYSVWLRTLPPH